MQGSVIHGVVTYQDGTKHPFEAGLREIAKAELLVDRALELGGEEGGPARMSDFLTLAYTDLRRQGELPNVGFEAWLDRVMDVDVKDEVADDPEALAPLTR